MNNETPWTSCFLTMMLIHYLERIGQDSGVDYEEILSGINYLNRIEDPKAFLKDFNNWVPHHVLKDLIFAIEKATGNKEITYLAAKNYFQPNQAGSLLEVIVKILNNVERTLIRSNLWASGYTNYLKLQCIRPSNPDKSEVIFLSQFGLSVEPSLGSLNLIRGNLEGFTRLFDYVEDVACTEEISQVKIENIAKEFEDYYIEKKGDQISVIETTSGKELVTARKVYLKSETLSIPDDDLVPTEELITLPKNGKFTVLNPQTETIPHNYEEENVVYEIVREGTLCSGPLKYTFQRGQFFNAPYSRFRYEWKSKGVPKELPEISKAKSEIVPLLFSYLLKHRETQKKQLECAIENKALEQANEILKTTIQKEFDCFGMIGNSTNMHKLFETAKMVAKSDSTVLILGETGTGKELLARAIYQASQRRDLKFIAINCAALPEDLLDAELFGYEKGAFTGALSQKKGIFEAANGGTLFLDEIGKVSPAMQVKLLRVLEEQEIRRVGGRVPISIDVRIISATNENLKDLVASKEFRSDLYYRLHVITLKVPPLRERLEDLILLVNHYLDLYSRKCKKQKPTITKEAIAILKSYQWPGNVRELKNIIERAVVLDMDQQVTPEDIVFSDDDDLIPETEVMDLKPFHEAIEGYKRHVIKEALNSTDGNQTKAAELLGLQRTYLVRLIKQLNITIKD